MAGKTDKTDTISAQIDNWPCWSFQRHSAGQLLLLSIGLTCIMLNCQSFLWAIYVRAILITSPYLSCLCRKCQAVSYCAFRPDTCLHIRPERRPFLHYLPIWFSIRNWDFSLERSNQLDLPLKQNPHSKQRARMRGKALSWLNWSLQSKSSSTNPCFNGVTSTEYCSN